MSGTLFGFLRPQASSKISPRTLTFAERVAYQTAIEDVYWHHRIWPAANSGPKPSLDKVMSQGDILKKVTDYLRNTQALEDYWQRPITSDQLQAEMERMARDTKQPEVLQELFEALGNDPFVIAECLARPIVAERLISDVLAPAVVATPLRGVARNVPQARGYSEQDGAQAPVTMAAVNRPYQLPVIASPSAGCIDDTWTATTTTNAPSARAVHTAVWTGSEMIVWGGLAGAGLYLNTGGRYNPTTDSWTATNTINAPSARVSHTAVWTGSEMIVWGGSDDTIRNTGGRYNPLSDSWTATSTTGAPEGRIAHTAVWTGTEMIVWGGNNGLNTGGRYNPVSDSWIATSTTNAPTARRDHTAVWAGSDSQMIVWGGNNGNGSIKFNTGGRYNPMMDSWAASSTTNAPAARDYHTAVWIDTGSQMIVWGGDDANFLPLNTGGRYDPISDSWTATHTTNAPTGRHFHTAVWDALNNQMIVWGGQDANFLPLNTGGRYDPLSDSWTATSTTTAPTERFFHTAVWTDNEMIVWGGAAAGNSFNTGGRYCAAAAGPTPTPTSSPSPTATATATATASATATPTATATATPTATASSTPRLTPTPRSRPTPAPRP